MLTLNQHISSSLAVFSVSTETKLSRPFIDQGISAGFPSPAQDFIDLSIDLNKELIKHPSSSFFGRVKGNSMIDAGISNGDPLIVDKSLDATDGKIAVCYIDGEFTVKRQMALGIKTAFDFTQLPDQWVRKNMSVVGLRLKHELEGKPRLDMEVAKAKQNIATTRSFDKNYTEFDQLRERITTFSVTCAEKLRRQKSCCNALLIFLHTNGFRSDLPQYSRNVVIKLPFPSNSSIEIAKFALEGLSLIFKKGFQYKKAGVIVMDITPEDANQISMFENTNPKHKLLMDVMDRLNSAIGQKKVKLASQALDRTWKMKQERLSPRYTTRLSEIITIHV